MEPNPYEPPIPPTSISEPARRRGMNLFDKCCAVLAFPLGVIFLILGAIGVFAGCSANFTLPPILGVLPALVGWGIVRAIYFGWSAGGNADAADL